MKNKVQQFHNKEFGSLEILLDDGKTYFPATECAVLLGYKNARKAILDHCKEDGVTNRDSIDRLGRRQEKKYISEGNLYRLIIRSKLPAAEHFEHWIFDEVLPTIRKYGAYMMDDILDAAEKSQDFAIELIGKLQAEKNKTAVLLERVESLAPKARYYDLILQSKSVVQVSIIAKDYGMTAVAFNRLLHDLGIQYRIGGTWLLYKNFANQGYTKTRTYYTPGGSSVIHTYWTQKGRIFLYDTLFEAGVIPLIDSDDPAM